MRCAALILALLLPLGALAQDNPIIARMQALMAAYNTQDAATIASLYAPDALLLPPGQRVVQGREAIKAHYSAAFSAGAGNLQFKTFDIRPLGEKAAVEIGETVVDANDQRIVGRYMHLWEVIDGQILLTRDIYHVLAVK